jgi:hypothetical protein
VLKVMATNSAALRSEIIEQRGLQLIVEAMQGESKRVRERGRRGYTCALVQHARRVLASANAKRSPCAHAYTHLCQGTNG